MGTQNQQHALVVMTNGDVYYLNLGEVAALHIAIEHGGDRLYHTTDVKSGAKLKLVLRHISSIVEEARNANR